MTRLSNLALRVQSAEVVIFDCDGVILNSNKIKTWAFEQVASPYGVEVAAALVAYHVENGGVSRYQKISYLINNLLEESLSNTSTSERTRLAEDLLNRFASIVKTGLLSCEIDRALIELRDLNPDALWCVASGGDEKELNEVFKERELYDLFNGGVYGSPRNKYQIMQDAGLENLGKSALFIGDSRLDYEVADHFGFDFVFVSHWTEFKNWEAHFTANNISVAHSLSDLTGIY